MAMPRRVMFVRHGPSEANLAGKKGNEKFLAAVRGIPDSEVRLALAEIEKVHCTGAWLREYLKGQTLSGFVSTFIRTLETAGNLGLGIEWKRHPLLIERNWGSFNQEPPEVQKLLREAARRDRLHARMPNGQAYSDLFDSTHAFFGTIQREPEQNTVIAVCHGERMWVVRYLLERMTETRFAELLDSRHLGDQIRNCQVLEYTRVDPETAQLEENLTWFRSFCPWDLREKDLKWRRIEFKKFTDQELLEEAERFPRFIQ